MQLPEPEHVSLETLKRCRDALREPVVKALLRRVYSKYLAIRFGMPYQGEGLRWGNHWRMRKGVLSVGNFVFVGPNVHVIYPTVLGDLCLIASGTEFVGNDHGYDDLNNPIRIASPKVDPASVMTVVAPDVWIGQSAIVFHGIRIGRGAVVAAGSIVTRDVPPYAVVAGVPARRIKQRFKGKQLEEYEERLYGEQNYG